MSSGVAAQNAKKTIVIHAGRHKTGTTFLQTVFGLNEAALLEYGNLLYPKSGRNPFFQYHHELIMALGSKNAKAEALVNDLKREIDTAGAGLVLISSEYLSRSSIDAAFLRNMMDNLRDYNVEVIFYLRKPSDFLCSRYAQQIRMAVLSHPKTIWDINAELDYKAFLERYIQAFGQGNVHVRSYDDVHVNGGLLKDFTTWLGLDEKLDLKLPPKDINKRYSWRYLSLLRYANKYGFTRKLAMSRPSSFAFKLAATLLPGIFDGKKPISSDEADAIDRENATSFQSVMENHGGTTLAGKRNPGAGTNT